MDQPSGEGVVRWTGDEPARAARAAVDRLEDQFYSSHKATFLDAQGDILEAMVRQGKVVKELRDENARLVERLSRETGQSLDYLCDLADTYELFRDELPNPHLAPAYYLEMARAVSQSSAAWGDNAETLETIESLAITRLSRCDLSDPSDGPVSLAESFRSLFGLANGASHPFVQFRMHVWAMEEDDLESFSAQFHEVVRPFFLEWARQVKTRSRPRSSRTNEHSLLTLSFDVELPTGERTRIEGVEQEVLRWLEQSGIKAKCLRKRLAPGFGE